MVRGTIAARAAESGTQGTTPVEQIVGADLILLIGAAVNLGWRRFRAFVERATARATAAAEMAKGSLLEGSDAEAIAATRPTAGLAAIRAHDPGFDEHDFLAGVESHSVRLMGAISETSRDELRPLVADGLFATVSARRRSEVCQGARPTEAVARRADRRPARSIRSPRLSARVRE